MGPTMEIHLIDDKEKIVFHQTVKNMDEVTEGCYTNTDIIVTTARIFIWQRKVYKKFDCMACPCYCCIWLGFLSKINHPRNLGNTMQFISLPSVLSFSTDMSLEP